MDLENMFNEEYQEEDLNKYVVFKIDDNYFSMHIDFILEVVLIDNITPVPDYPNFARGVINLRDEVIPIIDLRVIFKKEIKENCEKTHCVITEFRGHKYGILVDAVTDITDFGDVGVSEVPKASESYEYNFIIGVSKNKDNLVLILDPTKVFDPNKILDI